MTANEAKARLTAALDCAQGKQAGYAVTGVWSLQEMDWLRRLVRGELSPTPEVDEGPDPDAGRN